MKIFFTEKENVLSVKVSGELDHHNAPQIREETDFKITNDNIKNVIFDFSDLSFMDSAGIGVIIGRYKLLGTLGGKLYIVSPSKTINRILELSGIMKIIKVFDTIDDAEKEIDGGAFISEKK